MLALVIDELFTEIECLENVLYVGIRVCSDQYDGWKYVLHAASQAKTNPSHTQNVLFYGSVPARINTR